MHTVNNAWVHGLFPGYRLMVRARAIKRIIDLAELGPPQIGVYNAGLQPWTIKLFCSKYYKVEQ